VVGQVEVQVRIHKPLAAKELSEKVIETVYVVDEIPDANASSVQINLDHLVSNDVLEWELENVTKALAQGPNPELLAKKKAIEAKLQFLQQQVESGALTEEAYFEQLKKKIVEERENAKKLLQSGDRTAAALAVKRAKIMENEIAQSQ
jgi:hypothetical protein